MVLQRVIFIQALCIASVILVICQMSLAKIVANFQSAALTSAEHEKLCHNFSIGDPAKKEFYSPNYPLYYPNSLKCTRRISADPGHLVTIDFRDKFQLEASPSPKCENDKLEVRDGPYGYSPLLGTFCGSDFPNKMTSSGRYLWLQFISDDSIEYAGFRAVYDFNPVPGPTRPEIDDCVYQRTGPSGIIEKAHIEPARYTYAAKYDVPIDCMWIITADPGKNLYMNFKQYKLGSPNDCDKNYIEIYPESHTSSPLACFCGTSAEPKKTTSNVAHIRLFTHKDAFNQTNFTLHYTAFRELKKDNEQCDKDLEFNCGDQTCVDIKLKCDDEFDCKYQYDEDQTVCHKASRAGMVLTSEHMIVILVVFFALVVAMCASISISCYNKIKERQLREKEYKERRSKEVSVEATIERNLRGHSNPDERIKKAPASFEVQSGFRDDADDESSDGCYVPEVDLSVFKHPNGGENIPKRPIGQTRSNAQQQQYPYISESFESLPGDTIVPPAPPPVPLHMKDRHEVSQEPPMPSYRIVGGKVVANAAKNEPLERQFEPVGRSTLERDKNYGHWAPENRPSSTKPVTTIYSGYGKPGDSSKGLGADIHKSPTDREILGPTIDPKASFMRGPLEAGAPRSAFTRNPGEIGLPKFGMARVTPDGPRGPLAKGTTDRSTPLATFKSPYEDTSYAKGYRPGMGRSYKNPEVDSSTPNRFRAQATIEASDKESSRAESVASTLSAPDVIAKR